jgi:hypothetical protein
MTALGYPGVFPGGLTTGYTSIGAVQRQNSSALGYPGIFPGGFSTGYTNIGAAQADIPAVVTATTTEAERRGAAWMRNRAARPRPSVEREERQPEVTTPKTQPVVEPVVVQEPVPSPADVQAQAEAEALLLRSLDRAGFEAGPLPKAPIGGPDLEAVNAILQGAMQPSPEELAARERKRVMQLAIVAYVAMWRN